ncbi:MAG: ADP-ribosylation factor-like protein [Polyangiaceae bacterium]
MPTYDPFEQRMAVRVVYDGVANAGKTTNLRQLCTLFAAQRNSTLTTPAEMDGRTLYFDWVQILAGVVCGFPLLCQVVSVPGQMVLTPRRRHLLGSADVVVYVCDSSEAGIESARRGLALYDEVAKARGVEVPLVIQANKQDHVGALDGPSLARALGRPDVPVMEGIASEGVGVVDTFVAAVRTVSRAIQVRSEREELRVDVRHAETPGHLLEKLVEEKLDPEWAAEMLLEEAQSAFLVEEAVRAMADDEAARAVARAAALDLSNVEPAHRPKADGLVGPPSHPSPDVPTGFIWPAHTGRATVRLLDLAGVPAGAFDETGVLEVVAHGHVARTTVPALFADAEAARLALVRSARDATQLDRLLVPETVLVAQPAADGACWIWTVRPELPSVERILAEGSPPSDLVSNYGVAVVEALRTALRNGFSVDLSPRSFGVERGTLRYVRELSHGEARSEELTASMLVAVDAIERAGADVGLFLEAFENTLKVRVTREELARSVVLPPPSNAEGHDGTAEARLYAVIARHAEPS